MNRIIKILFLIFLTNNTLFACALCSIYSPRTDVAIDINANKEFIKDGTFTWTFSREFTNELLNLYDINLDGKFSEKELEGIENALLSYIEPRNYLTFLSYDKEMEKESRVLDIKEYKLIFRKNILSFEYLVNFNYKIIDNNKLYISIKDDAEYFKIFFEEMKQYFTIPYQTKKEFTFNSISYTIDAPSMINNIKEIKENPKLKKSEENIIEHTFDEKTLEKDEKLEIKETEVKPLDKFIKKIKESLLEIEKGEDKYAIFFLLFASFIYGVIHALGPGHGKALAFSYFSSRKSSYTQAFAISFFTAFIHIVGALVLVSISIFIIEGIFSSFLDDSITYITKTSAVLIMLLSLFILYRKLKKKSCACCACTIPDNKNQLFTAGNLNSSKKSNFVFKSSNNIHVKTNNKNENLFFVLTAGLIPCPGTVILFVYAFILETYFSVFLASIFISLGMGLVIFASSFLGVSLHKVSSKSSKFTNILEIASPIFMFFLGLFLLLNWQTI